MYPIDAQYQENPKYNFGISRRKPLSGTVDTPVKWFNLRAYITEILPKIINYIERFRPNN